MAVWQSAAVPYFNYWLFTWTVSDITKAP